MHSENCVVVIRAGKLSRRVGDKHFDKFHHINTTRANYLHSHTLRDIARFHNIVLLSWHVSSCWESSAQTRHRSKIWILYMRQFLPLRKRAFNASSSASIFLCGGAQR